MTLIISGMTSIVILTDKKGSVDPEAVLSNQESVGRPITIASFSHGLCRQYYKVTLDNSLDCPNWDGGPKDSEKVFFHYPRFVDERRNLDASTGKSGSKNSRKANDNDD